ncbi:MAG: phosphopentomutase [Bryobacterales bacterium]|nr:phosphopentomutase [Bryobacteraceae bacterium]MDW8129226.1 phosphopentomutase [Bryobacterales bacterium]
MADAAFERVFLVVLDSLGIGELPDAEDYGDRGSDTLGNLARARPLRLPNLARLGLGNIRALEGIPPAASPIGSYGRSALASPGKDTTTGHWELAGIQLSRPFPTYPHGFPPEIVREFERRIGRRILGNVPASGTEIIERLGEEHLHTGRPIVYTSADSVFQVAAHEQVVPLEELYRICQIARELLRGEHEVGRVIARPFTGRPGAFVRDQQNRRDYAVAPPQGTLLDRLAEAGVPVCAVGKIYDIFLGRGITEHRKTRDNAHGMEEILRAAERFARGLVFANLVDFDSLYGHRNDVEGFARALEAVDAWLPELLERLGEQDLLILTADHGNDPTTPSTDHSREYVPLLVYAPRARRGVNLGTRSSLADVGQTVAANFLGRGHSPRAPGAILEKGTSFLDAIL